MADHSAFSSEALIRTDRSWPPYGEDQLAAQSAPPDVTAPVVGGFSPAQGTALAPTDAVTFDVTDETELRRMIVAVALSTGEQELAYDGVAFTARYAGSKRTTLIADKSYRFSLVRTGGWPAGATITVRVFAADAAGNNES